VGNGPHINLNRVGRMHANRSDGTWTPLDTSWWDLAVGATTIDNVVAELERHTQLPPPTEEARRMADSADVVVQIIAQVAAQLDPAVDWTWRNGMLDTSGHSSGGHHDEWFEQFTSAVKALRQPAGRVLLDQAAYRFWFLLRSDDPVACLETTGAAHDHNGTTRDLITVETGASIVSEILASAAASAR
jgi:hypothetical protein